MKESIKNDILFLAQTIFNNEEYAKMINYLNHDRLNDLRLMISDKLEVMNNVVIVDRENRVLQKQIQLCNKLEDIILDEFITVE